MPITNPENITHAPKPPYRALNDTERLLITNNKASGLLFVLPGVEENTGRIGFMNGTIVYVIKEYEDRYLFTAFKDGLEKPKIIDQIVLKGTLRGLVTMWSYILSFLAENPDD